MKRSFLVVAALLFLLPSLVMGFNADSSCVKCHGDLAKMEELEAAAMYLDPAQVDQEVNMGGAPTCVDCHMGNPQAVEKDLAHDGMLGPFLMAVGKKVKGQAVERSDIGLTPLEPKGKKQFASMIPKADKETLKKAGLKKVLGLYYHDRDPKTFAYSPKIAEATCGKCHAKEVKDYSSSSKGLMKHQRAFKSFTEGLPGPQNCGAWYGDNFKSLAAETSVPYNAMQNAAIDRQCNKCHAGCNDCHLQSYKGEGRHRFGPAETPSCYGGGRASICHAGPMDRRRGAGYMRGEYAFPKDLPQGAHVQNGVECLDCHSAENHQFGHLASDEARNSCKECHMEIVEAVESSEHTNVDCASCHIQAVGAYQFTFWGPGKVAGVKTPYAKHKEYYGTRNLPTLIKNPAGRWIPVKPYPMAVMNQNKNVEATGLRFRAIPERTIKGKTELGEPETFTVARGVTDVNDAFIINGTRSDLPGNNKALLWIQMDKMSHGLGEARECDSCHASKSQVSRSEFIFASKKDVKKPFTGSYTMIADAKGMRFTDIETSQIEPVDGRMLEDFAPFKFFPEGWNVAGIDFSLPFDEEKYEKSQNELQEFLRKLEKRGQDSQIRTIRMVAYHNLIKAKEMFKKIK